MAFGMSPFPLQFGSRGGAGGAVIIFAVEGGCIVVRTFRTAYPRFTVDGGCIVVTGERVR